MRAFRGIAAAALVVAVATSTSPHSTRLMAAPQGTTGIDRPFIRAGQIPGELTLDDITQIERLTAALSRLPWLSLGELGFSGQWILEMYATPDVVDSGVRRGRMMYVVTRDAIRADPQRRWMTDGEWQGDWAQVTAAGRSPDDVQNETDVNGHSR